MIEREYEYHLRDEQKEIYNNLARFNVLLAHRRMGKTVFAVILLIRKALECKHKRPQVHYYAPSYSQAKKVAWAYVKQYTEGIGAIYNEAELKCTMPTGAVRQLGSAENPDSSRGIYSDYVVLDEPAQMPSRMWTEVLRPALSDRKGGALFIGTPKGRHGLFYESYQLAETDPLWWRGMYKASETGIVDQEELQANQRAMTRAEYLQEFECSFDAAIKGAYWGEVMSKLEADGNITTVSHDPQYLVNCSFDLGINDATAIWYFQVVGDEYRFIDYEEITNTGLPDIIKHMKKKDYNYGQMVFPHDVQVRSLSTGQTRLQTLQQLGVDCVVAPSLSIIDGIDTARSVLPRCYFDSVRCKDGVEALRQYRSDWKDKQGVLSLAPIHDWSSHGADSFRYLAITPLSAIIGQWAGEIDYSKMDRAIR